MNKRKKQVLAHPLSKSVPAMAGVLLLLLTFMSGNWVCVSSVYGKETSVAISGKPLTTDVCGQYFMAAIQALQTESGLVVNVEAPDGLSFNNPIQQHTSGLTLLDALKGMCQEVVGNRFSYEVTPGKADVIVSFKPILAKDGESAQSPGGGEYPQSSSGGMPGGAMNGPSEMENGMMFTPESGMSPEAGMPGSPGGSPGGMPPGMGGRPGGGMGGPGGGAGGPPGGGMGGPPGGGMGGPGGPPGGGAGGPPGSGMPGDPSQGGPPESVGEGMGSPPGDEPPSTPPEPPEN